MKKIINMFLVNIKKKFRKQKRKAVQNDLHKLWQNNK